MGHVYGMSDFIRCHSIQLTSLGVPDLYWNTLYYKLKREVFDAGDILQLLQLRYEPERPPHRPVRGLQVLCNIDRFDRDQIYLIDHVWTFRVSNARDQLIECDVLRERVCGMLGIHSGQPREAATDLAFERMWKLVRPYAIRNTNFIEDHFTVWYVTDEIGSAVIHSESPNCRIVPFVFVKSRVAYSLLFPIRDIRAGEFVVADFAEGVHYPICRAAMLIPWKPCSFCGISFVPRMPTTDYYVNGHTYESLPDLSRFPTERVVRDKYTVYTEYNTVKDFLTHERFEFTDDEDNADILWCTCHYYCFAQLSETPHRFVNEFPYEYVMTSKDLFAATCRKTPDFESSISGLDWWPVTYNLRTEVPNFISYFQDRQQKGLDNHWVVKPSHRAMNLDTHITNNLDYIIRLIGTGPKICQKYGHDPVLFHVEGVGRVKFDLRYLILLKSVRPLEAYVYKNFYLRLSGKPFELKLFHEYEKHFTRMNFEDNVHMKHLLPPVFISELKAQYPDYEWNDVETKIFQILRQVLVNAQRDDPPCGIASDPQSRAIYGADFMVQWGENRVMQPMILEMNFMPDCQKVVNHYNNFYNDAFALFFLDQPSDLFVKL